ncbi:MAG: RluA family pseudouridine synthase [Hyphomicrobium sp.]|jgi:23S rRNA pseudouridine1911/1915/1917 synthase
MSDTLAEQHAGLIELQVGDAEAGIRLDKLLAQRITTLSRARIQALIRSGNVTGPGGATIGDGSHRVKPGETFTINVPEPEPAEPSAEEIALDVVYEDRDLIVIDKPAHLVVHPGAGHASGTLVNALIAHCGASLSGIGGVKRPGIVHRLDKGTSGLLVVAKNDSAHQSLSEQFAAHGADGRMHRAYLALVWGKPLRPRGAISARLARSKANRTKITVTSGEGGRHAVTHYELIETIETHAGPVSLLRLELETGRTHQIRVHLAHIGHPVLGDAIYASGFKAKAMKLGEASRAALSALDRQALHAAELGFEHPRSGKALRFASPIPPDMQALLGALRRD